MDEDDKSDLVSEPETFGPEDVVDDPDFEETAFIDDSIVIDDEPMAGDNVASDVNPTEIQDDEVNE